LNTEVLGAQGSYYITLFNGQWTNASLLGNGGDSGGNFYTDGKGIGALTLNVGCTLANGKIIKAGDFDKSNSSGSANTSTSNTGTVPAFSGNGFPGLQPVDFSDVAKVPLVLGQAQSGAISTKNSDVLGFTFNGKANDVLDLTFTRVSGNLNVGLVVLSSDNKVVFQASLITSKTLNTQFIVPYDGTYTIGVFRIDLLAPSKPEATAFQLAVNASK
jgi:hypothetical protein